MHHQSSLAADRPRYRRRRRATAERTSAGVVERGGGDEEGALRVRRQQEDESGARDLHNGLAEEARNPGLMHVHPCCRLQPERLSPDPPTQGRTVCPPPKRQGNPAGLW